jgi:hypothetical protein
MTGRSDAVVGEAVGVVVDAVVGAAARGGERARVREREREREREIEREREREKTERTGRMWQIFCLSSAPRSMTPNSVPRRRHASPFEPVRQVAWRQDLWRRGVLARRRSSGPKLKINHPEV